MLPSRRRGRRRRARPQSGPKRSSAGTRRRSGPVPAGHHVDLGGEPPARPPRPPHRRAAQHLRRLASRFVLRDLQRYRPRRLRRARERRPSTLPILDRAPGVRAMRPALARPRAHRADRPLLRGGLYRSAAPGGGEHRGPWRRHGAKPYRRKQHRVEHRDGHRPHFYSEWVLPPRLFACGRRRLGRSSIPRRDVDGSGLADRRDHRVPPPVVARHAAASSAMDRTDPSAPMADSTRRPLGVVSTRRLVADPISPLRSTRPAIDPASHRPAGALSACDRDQHPIDRHAIDPAWEGLVGISSLEYGEPRWWHQPRSTAALPPGASGRH